MASADSDTPSSLFTSDAQVSDEALRNQLIASWQANPTINERMTNLMS
jgi:hypothetical protein